MDATGTVCSSQDPSRASSRVRNQIDDLYNGDLSLKQEPLYRIVRIYLSAELSDSTVEKCYLARHVYPQVRQLCQSLSLQCVIVDLFQAVPVTIATPTSEKSVTPPLQTTSDEMMYKLEAKGLLEMARDEIKLCQEVSVGPTFVTLLAQRYGHKALHKCIPEDHFKLFLAAIDEPGMRQLMTEWYREDINAHPPQYVLQSHRGMSVEKWGSIHQSLSRTTRKAAKVALGKDISKAQQYTMSVIEEEISLGIFQTTRDPNQTCVWLKRTFTDLQEQRPSADTALATYTDLTEGKRGLEFDQDTLKILNHLKEARMPAKYVGLESTNIFEFSLKWQRGEGVNVEAHSEYLSQLSEQLFTSLESMISHENALLLTGGCENETHEILCQANYCRKQSIGFMDRPSVTIRILDYLTSCTSATPLVLFGCVGSGKTSMMAGVASKLRGISSLKKSAIVLRFIQATSNAHSVRHLLLNICKQLCVVYRQQVGELPQDYRFLCQTLAGLLHCASTDKPLIILLDGVDELSPEDGALGLSWLPLKLPEHVKIVLSTSSEIRYSCYPVLQSLLANQPESFLEVPELSSNECQDMLHHSLRAKGRSLTTTQERVVLDALSKCRNPLYLQLLLREVTTWHSYQWNSSWTPATDLPGVVKQFFAELEAKLGRVFVRSALGYITASGDGLTEMELLDILSTDNEVMREVNQRWCVINPPGETLTAIPPLLMSMFHQAVRPLLDYHSGCGSVLVLRWSHRVLHEVAESTYLSYRPTAQARYNSLANYFTGDRPAGRSAAGETEPMIKQPVIVSSDLGLYNVRKLCLLPRLLTLAQRHYDLQKLLVDYEWIKGSIAGSSVLDLVAEFAAVLPLVPLARSAGSSDTQYELVLLRDALSQSVSSLSQDPHTLPSQLLGRLMPYVKDSLTWQWPNLKEILLRAFVDHCPLLTPLHPLYHLPGGPLLVTMEGHRGAVTGLASTVVRRSSDDTLTMVVISSSQDKTLKSWDVKSTGVIKTFDGHTDQVLCVALTLNGRYAVSGSADHIVRHWVVETAECGCVLHGHDGSVEAVLITGEGHKTISASSDCAIKVWNTDTDSRTYGQIIFTFESHSPLTALSLCPGNQWIVSLHQNGHVALVDIVSGERRRVVSGETVTAITTARAEWFKYLLTGTVTGEVIVRDWTSMEISRVLRPPVQNEPVLALVAGYKVVASYKNIGLVVWDLLSGAHLYSLMSGGEIFALTLADQGDLLITGGIDQRVRIWDLKRSGDSRSVSQHDGAVLSVVLSPCGHYGLSAGEDSMVNVYELATMKIVNRMQAKAVSKLFALRDGKHFLTSSSKGCVTLWDGEKGAIVQEFGCPGERLTCIAMTTDLELLVAGSESGKLLFWNASSGQKLKTLSSHNSTVMCVTFAKGADFNCIVSTSKSGELCIRNFLTGKLSLQYKLNTVEISCSAVNASGSLLATGNVDTNCYILAIPSGKQRSVLMGHTLAVTGVSFTPDNTQCFTASLDKTIRLFDIASADCMAVFQTDLPITCLDGDINGEMILYGTSEGWVSIAHCRSGRNRDNPLVRTLKGEASDSSVSSLSTVSASSANSNIGLSAFNGVAD